MTLPYYVNCVNCGQQVRVEGPADRCYWCGKSAMRLEYIKEDIVEEKAVPARPKKRSQLRAYFEANKEAVIADYQSMPLREFYKHWGMSPSRWTKLKREWEVPAKPKIGRPGPRVLKAPAEAKAEPELDELVGKKGQSDVELLAEQNIRIAYLTGYQQAARDFFQKK